MPNARGRSRSGVSHDAACKPIVQIVQCVQAGPLPERGAAGPAGRCLDTPRTIPLATRPARRPSRPDDLDALDASHAPYPTPLS